MKLKLFLLLVVALCFRLPGLDAVLESDELAMVSLWAQMPYEEIIRNYQYPNNHIFLTLLLSFLLKTFGLYEWLLRLPILICGIISIYLGYRAGKLIGESLLVGWITGFILAMSEWHIFFSTNARGYLVIMVLGQICFEMILRQLKENTNDNQNKTTSINSVFILLVWLVIWVVGSWTIPTFIFFELSFLIFLVGIILFRRGLTKEPVKEFISPLLALLVGLVAFYIQYYVFISPKMLASAASNSAQSSLDTFFMEVLVQWLAPFEAVSLIFLFLAVVGCLSLWKQSIEKLFLVLSILIGPILAGILGVKFNLLPGVPHARTYFYLQPFFIILAAMGFLQLGEIVREILRHKIEYGGKLFPAIAGGVAIILLFIATTNFLNIYNKRSKRDPLDKLLEFTKSLKPNDLIIVPDKLHVEFYLYGAVEMRRRAERILEEGQIGNIFFLEYHKNGTSTFKVGKNGEFINIMGYPPLVNNSKNIFPALPATALKQIVRFGPFVVHQLKSNWLNKKKTWENDMESLGVVGEKNFRWEKEESGNGFKRKLKFVDSFLIALRERQAENQDSLTINLMRISGSDREFSGALLNGNLVDKQIEYNPAWKVNGWTLDHPYGSSIFDREWNPTISLSSGTSRIAVLDVHYFNNKGAGSLKDFLSYEISNPNKFINSGENGT